MNADLKIYVADRAHITTALPTVYGLNTCLILTKSKSNLFILSA